MTYQNDDMIIACAKLVDRTGASGFEIGHTGEDDDPADAPIWYAYATFQGTRIMVQAQSGPTAAALALSERLLDGATCRCRQKVTLTSDRPGCRWRLMGDTWEPGCDVEPIHVEGALRGDYKAIQAALEQPLAGNREMRRRMAKKEGKKK